MIKVDNVGIIGLGSYFPEKILTNKDIDLLGIGTDSSWTKEKLGIEERRVVVDENPSDLAYHASIAAIKDAGIDKEEIDLIIVATSSPDRISPSTACIMAKRLDVKKPAFDINAVCTGFVYGIQLATNLISTKQYKKILLIGAEAYSKITDWSKRDCVFFGDGAGAIILSEVNGGWISTDIFGDANGKEAFTCHHSGKFKMDGKAVYEFGTNTLPKTIKNSLDNTFVTGTTIRFYQQSQLRASGQTFEFVGAGTTLTTALPRNGGIPNSEAQIVRSNGGAVFCTSTNESGDFQVSDLIIEQTTGTISGRTFSKSLYAELTPFILALEG